MMFIDTVLFFVITSISLCSFIGFGALTNDYLFKEKYNKNVFNYFFISLIFIIPFSVIYYFLIGNYKILNFLIIILGFYFFLRKIKFGEIKFILILSFIFFTCLLISKSHEDFTVYHFQHIVEISDSNLKFGLANLDTRYFYSSIFSYVQALFKFDFFGYNLINIPLYLIFLSTIGYLYKQINLKKNVFINIFFLFLIIFKFKRFSEFGYDYVGQFILIYLFSEFIYRIKNIHFNSLSKLILIFSTSVLIKVTNIYFTPIIFFYFLSFKKKINIIEFIKSKYVLYPQIILVLIFSLNSVLKTGCVNYLIKDSCLSKTKYSWVLNYEEIQNSKKISKYWSRGFYHQKMLNLMRRSIIKTLIGFQTGYKAIFILKFYHLF